MSNYTSLLNEKVLKAVYEHNMLENTSEIVVGFSGGADSVCLLHILNSLRASFGFSLKAVHINHGIRGEEAERDEAFARAFCTEYNIPFECIRFNCIEEAEKSKETLEECGRRLRYESFNGFCGENSRIATAHNANDNAETIIFNIARGTSVKGLCGIPLTRDNIIRPLLYCTRAEIEGYCRENQLDFVTDSTNLSTEYTRNKIRHLILPVLEEINPAYLSAFNSISKNAREVTDFLESSAYALLNEAKIGEFIYNRRVLLNADKAVVFRLLHSELLSFADINAESKKIEQLYELLQKCGRLQLYGNIFSEVKKDHFRFFLKSADTVDYEIKINSFPFNENISEYSVKLEKITDYSKIVNQYDISDVIDYNSVSGNLVLRTRKAGDSFTFSERNVTKTLKKLFTEENIPIEERYKIPVISDDKGVVWVYGFGVTKRCRATAQSDNIILVRGKNNDR